VNASFGLIICLIILVLTSFFLLWLRGQDFCITLGLKAKILVEPEFSRLYKSDVVVACSGSVEHK